MVHAEDVFLYRLFAAFFDFALAVYCMYIHSYVYNSMYNVYVLFTYVGPGRVEIVDVKVSVEEERSRMKVTLRKVRLHL